MNEILEIISTVGFPIASALVAGYFIFLSVNYILAGLENSVNGMKNIINALDNRVKTMNNDLLKIDIIISNILGLKTDVNRVSRSDGKNDSRKD
jgi:hypothetical protein